MDGQSRFSYSFDGKTFMHLGEPYPLTWGHYRGDRIGIFNYNSADDAGQIDIESFHFTFDRATRSR